uniref:aspartate kinase n=1 Tax=Eutreptiella gymnastica TaxID=73025 RepID=A0A7S1NHN1_9EUGL|mmetsp:Transcript_37365/g.66613  ORF Transcript_37365/g.66613 Transcript_37365/m.66613 type:complete len:120 (+) Transcript_37365:312-671(+)
MTSTMAPAMKANIPIRIKSTFKPDDAGTVVTNSTRKPSPYAIRGVTALQNVALLHIRGRALKAVSDLAGRLLTCLAKSGIQMLMVSQASVVHSISIAIRETDGQRATKVGPPPPPTPRC